MVLADVPKADRCRCRQDGAPKKNAAAPLNSGDSAFARFRGWLQK